MQPHSTPDGVPAKPQLDFLGSPRSCLSGENAPVEVALPHPVSGTAVGMTGSCGRLPSPKKYPSRFLVVDLFNVEQKQSR